MCDQLPNRTCPFCEEVYEDNAEYVDVGVGGYGVQVTPNVCEECGAQQQGAYDYDSKDFEFASGWVRPKYKMPNGQPDWKNGGTPEDFFDIIEEQIDVEPGTLKTVLDFLCCAFHLLPFFLRLFGREVLQSDCRRTACHHRRLLPAHSLTNFQR